jgi:hypothetical protein
MLRQHLRDGRRQRRLAMVDVTNRPDVAVRLIAIKFLFRHKIAVPRLKWYSVIQLLSNIDTAF